MKTTPIIPVAPSPQRVSACPPCIGPGISPGCSWEKPESGNVDHDLAGTQYHCARFPEARTVVLSDGAPALTHGNKVRRFRPSAIPDIVARVGDDVQALAGIQSLFAAVRSNGAGNTA